MGIYQRISDFGKKTLLVGGLVAVLSGCDQSPTMQLKGTVQSEQRGGGWYQVSIDGHNMNPLRYEDSIKIRFYSNNFDLDEIDNKINKGNKLTLVGTAVVGRGVDYEWKVDAIDKIE